MQASIKEVRRMLLLGLIIPAVGVYLIYALIHPDKF